MTPTPEPWQPDTNKKNLAVLGKLLEELNELGAVLARCIIQGINENDPKTHQPNIEKLENEIADVLMGISIAMEYFDLNEQKIYVRQDAKIEHKKAWHKLLT